jgi:hypothetical protein
MCRWLLMMHDRAGHEALPYAHASLWHILGARGSVRARMKHHLFRKPHMPTLWHGRAQ